MLAKTQQSIHQNNYYRTHPKQHEKHKNAARINSKKAHVEKRTWQYRYPQKMREYQKNYRKTHLEELREYQHLWYLKHKVLKVIA